MNTDIEMAHGGGVNFIGFLVKFTLTAFGVAAGIGLLIAAALTLIFSR